MPQITDSVGRVLGKRYRLVSALGTGASAHVFLAEDVTLQRLVAVKVLQPELVHNEGFLKRFRAEARSVASLNHPNVLRVFDWGEDPDGPYLVLEYLGGGSLRDMLDRGTRLSLSQAARVGAQAAHGLAYAHARGLVHRDVKPANLLFDDEGRVRVADFGVARALAEAAWTEPAGAVIGTARYAAPEQAQGQSVDGRADVYSLALVLYEAVTGEVPFVQDTTFGTLMARVGAPLPHHEALGPLDNVLARAAAPEPEARLDAAGFAARLEALASALPSPAPLPIRPPTPPPAPSGGFRPPTARDLTEAVPAAGAGRDRTAIAASIAGTAAVDQTLLVDPGATGAPTTVGGPAAGPYDGAAPAPYDDALAPPPGGPPVVHRRRRRRWPWIVAATVVVLAVVAGLLVAAKEKVFTASHPVPNVTGLTVAAARQRLDAVHFVLVTAAPQYSKTVASGRVIDQQPRPTVVMKEGSTVTVVPSRGVPFVPVPSLTGLDCTAAQRVLSVAGLTGVCPAANNVPSTTVLAGQVINWSWDNKLNPTTAPYHSTVLIATSSGPPPVPVPAVTGDTWATAESALVAAGFTPTEVQAYNQTVGIGLVVSTSPVPGTLVQKGTTVVVTVSEGPPLVAVPSTGGDTVTQATAALSAVGLKVANVYGPTAGHVFQTNPAPGASVAVGSSVNLYTK